MVRDRHHALAGLVPAIAIACCLALAGCGGSDRTATTQPAQTGAQASAGGPAVSTPAASTAPASTARASTPAGTAATTPPVSGPSIPPYLCQATDLAQNAADAYMGALSAGDLKQAAACVLPHTVPAAVTAGLLSKEKGTAVYLPRDGVDGPIVFGYRGNGKSIDVTITREPDGRFWVTRVLVRAG